MLGSLDDFGMADYRLRDFLIYVIAFFATLGYFLSLLRYAFFIRFECELLNLF